jgi:hypothetical protein
MVFSGNFFLTLIRTPLTVTPVSSSIDPLLYSHADTTSISDKNLTSGVDMLVNNDGTKLYILKDVNGTNNDIIYEYTLSTAWDASTASQTATKTISGSEALTYGAFCFNGDGTKIYVHSYTANSSKISRIYDFPLSTAYDLSTMDTSSRTTTSLSPSGDRPGQKIVSMNFNGDGTKIYLTNSQSSSGYDNNRYVYVFTLSTAYDVSSLAGKDPYSASDVDYTFDYSALLNSGNDIPFMSWKFVDNGNYLYGLYNNFGGAILDLTSSPYDLSSLTGSNIIENVTDSSLDTILDPSGQEKTIVVQEPIQSESKFLIYSSPSVYTREFNVPP